MVPIHSGIDTTIMTLLVVPVLYTYFDTWGEKASAWFKRGTPHTSPAAPAHAASPVAGGGAIEPMPAARKVD